MPGLQVLLFKVNGDDYCLDISKVASVLKDSIGITRVPGAAPCVRGVANLRGEILPIMDLRLRLAAAGQGGGARQGGAQSAAPGEARIIIVKSDGISVGLVVDSVSEVVKAAESDIEGLSAIGGGSLPAEDAIGILRARGRAATLLNADSFMQA
ncbi:MAG: chemotaxis protein CheW [Clostridiales bacterium]|jgi:purine-binding chemotaxis protein CheW|nr:chemotaxis protein CheW [Clostridiales bacterium]